jgi:hypothetical protein
MAVCCSLPPILCGTDRLKPANLILLSNCAQIMQYDLQKLCWLGEFVKGELLMPLDLNSSSEQ